MRKQTIDHSTGAGDDGRGSDAASSSRRTPAGAVAAYRAAAVAIGAIGVVVLWHAQQLVYYTPYGPGPAFFPRWLAALLIVLALGLLAGSFVVRPSPAAAPIPPPGVRLELAVTLGAILAFTLLIERLGFVLTVFPMLMVLLLARRCRLPLALAVATAASFGVGYVFMNHLGVSLPRAPRDLLLPIGL